MSKRFLPVILMLSFFSLSAWAVDIPHPLNFKGTDLEKKKVIAFIEKSVHKTYCENPALKSMCIQSNLRMMEETELKSFKELTKVKNRTVLDRVMKTYCQNPALEGLCNFSNLLMMYKEEMKAAGKKLKW